MQNSQGSERTKKQDASKKVSHLSKTLVSIRDGVETDRSFIYSTFLRGLYYGSDSFKCVSEHSFYIFYHALLDLLLVKPGVSVKVACLKDDADVILSYAILEGPIIHWMFTKPVWRKLGIAKSLLPTQINHVTHMTKLGKILLPQDWEFKPLTF